MVNPNKNPIWEKIINELILNDESFVPDSLKEEHVVDSNFKFYIADFLLSNGNSLKIYFFTLDLENYRKED